MIKILKVTLSLILLHFLLENLTTQCISNTLVNDFWKKCFTLRTWVLVLIPVESLCVKLWLPGPCRLPFPEWSPTIASSNPVPLWRPSSNATSWSSPWLTSFHFPQTGNNLVLLKCALLEKQGCICSTFSCLCAPECSAQSLPTVSPQMWKGWTNESILRSLNVFVFLKSLLKISGSQPRCRAYWGFAISFNYVVVICY